MKRHIPLIMATQHPDNISAPHWLSGAFISTHDEIEECYRMFSEFGCDEYMWDWEGKFVDEAVIERLFQNYFSFFKKKQFGKDIFLTFRIPNIWREKGYRIARAFMGILTADEYAKSIGFHSPPIFEIILPMAKSEKQLSYLYRTFKQMSVFKAKAFDNAKARFHSLDIIPIFEDVHDLTASHKVLKKYIKSHAEEFGEKLPYMRVFIARSDPALNSGFVSATIAAKIALNNYYRLSKEEGIPIYPIIGMGCLPFRGGLNPENLDSVLEEYRGVKTLTVQSAFRYDYPAAETKKAIKKLKNVLSRPHTPVLYDDKELIIAKKIIEIFEKYYKNTVEKIAPFINDASVKIPQRRERMLHTGLFGYSRCIGGKVYLPRAIPFTAVLYSFGVPPEFIGLGRALCEIKNKGWRNALDSFFSTIKKELFHAGKYLNEENLDNLSEHVKGFDDIKEDLHLTKKFFDAEFKPSKINHLIHRNLTSSIYLQWKIGEDFIQELEKAAKIRKSLG